MNGAYLREGIDIEDSLVIGLVSLNNYDVVEGFVSLGNEILKELGGDIDAVCDTIGTAGTLMGIAKSFKKAGSDCKIVALEMTIKKLIKI